MLPYAIELDGQFAGQLTIGNVTHGALRSAWIGYWVASGVTGEVMYVDAGFNITGMGEIED